MPFGDCESDKFEADLAKELAKCKPKTNEEIIYIVECVLKDYGIDHKHWQEVKEIKKDLAWIRDARTRCDSLKSHGLGTIATVLVIGFATLVTLGVKLWIWE